MSCICVACKANILLVLVGSGSVTGQATVESCYKISEHEQSCFKSIKNSGELKTWPAARTWCLNQTGGGYTLATVRDDVTQDALTSFLYDHELTSRNVWIGARQAVNSRWIWIDGSSESSQCCHVIYHLDNKAQ